MRVMTITARPNLTAGQNARLADDLLRAPALRQHKIPRWMHKRLRALPDNPIGYESFGAAWVLHGTPHRMLDHWGYYVAADGREVFVTEPYDVNNEVIRAALDLASAVDAYLYVSPVSSHYPGWTVRIEFWPGAVIGPVQE